MRRVLIAFACVVLVMGGLSSQAFGQVPENQRSLVTDPNQLEKMGFPKNATNVYIGMNLAPAVNRPEEPSAPNDFGLGSHYLPVAPKAFVGRQNTAASTWQYSGGDEGCCTNVTRTGTEPFADAQVVLPTGVNIQFVRWWASDTSVAGDISVFVFEVCHPAFAGGPTTFTTIFSASPATTGSSGNQSGLLTQNFTSPYVMNNQTCQLTARVNFEATSGLTLQKLRFQWNQQITPAPASATFGDVPTSHPYFQFIEALAASGITTGCGTGANFCPGDPVTRGQMAVFLARALGL